MSSHASLTGANLHAPFPYEQDNDPGAVGAGKFWADTVNARIKRRNAANAAWVTYGGGVEGYTAVPSGSTWAEFLAIYNAAADGETLVLPNETIIQTSNLWIVKPISILGHPGGLSNLKLLNNVTLSGSAQQIAIGSYSASVVDGVILDGFTMEHDRPAMQSAGSGTPGRTLAISVFHGIRNLIMRNLHFKGITADCIIVRDQSRDGTGVIKNLYVLNCLAQEWWESFFNHREGNLINAFVLNNIGTVFAGGHPDPLVTRPYCTILNMEDADFPGAKENIHICNNSFYSNLFDFSLGVGGQDGSGVDFVDSIGFVMRQNDDCNYRAHRVYVSENLYDGFDRGLWHIETRKGTPPGGTGPCYVYYTGNTFRNNGTYIANVDDWGGEDDIVFVGDNDFVINNSNTPLLLPASAGLATIIQQPPNRTISGTIAAGAVGPVTLISDGTYNAFPGLARFPIGEALLAIWWTGANHLSIGVTKYQISTDSGATWSSPVTVPGDGYGSDVELLANGTFLVSAWGSDPTVKVQIATITSPSTVTFGSHIAACSVGTEYTASSPSKPIQLLNGDVLLPIYIKNLADACEYAAVIRSTDYGLTWGAPVTIAANVTSVRYNEAEGVLLPLSYLPYGRIVIMIRNETLSGYSRVYSDDNGFTWSSPVDVIDLGAGNPMPGKPCMAILPSGHLFLLTRGDGTGELGRALYTTSSDGGESWSTLTNYGADMPFVYAGMTPLANGHIAAIMSRETTQTDARIIYQEFEEV